MKNAILFISFLLCSCSETKITKVGIQPLSNFDRSLTNTLASTLQDFYGVKTTILPQKDIPKEAFVNIKTPRYKASKIIEIQNTHKPDSLDYIFSLTELDISVSKKDAQGNIKEPQSKYADWGIMGLAYCPGKSCIVSTYRLKNKDQLKFISRFKKVCIHEFGHNLGLPHCDSPNCVMRDAAETIQTIDQVKMELCDKCKQKLK